MCVSRHDVRHMRFFNVILFKRKSTCSDNLLWRFPSKRVLCQCVFASCFMKTLQSIVPSFLPRSTCTNPFAKPRFHYQPIQFFPSKNGGMSPRKNAQECGILPVPTYLAADHTSRCWHTTCFAEAWSSLTNIAMTTPKFCQMMLQATFPFRPGACLTLAKVACSGSNSKPAFSSKNLYKYLSLLVNL